MTSPGELENLYVADVPFGKDTELELVTTISKRFMKW